LACSRPCEKGEPFVRWSSAEIAQKLVALGVVVRIAASTVGRWLAQDKIKPWRFHHWQHILDPDLFLERARPILELYNNAQAWWAQGVWIVCADEKTSIQARERPKPPDPAIPGHPVHVSHRYQRRGALHLFGAFSVVDGWVGGVCRQRKRFVDFQAFLLDVVIPEAVRRGVHTVALILDNGTTHAPKQLERWLEEQRQARGWTVAVEVFWLPPNASWLDQIEIWFSILQRKLLQPNHFTSLRALTLAILAFIARHNQTAKPIQWTYTFDKLEKKLGVN
jgi:transposase